MSVTFSGLNYEISIECCVASGIIHITGTVRTNEEYPLMEPVEATRLGLPFIGNVILTEFKTQQGPNPTDKFGFRGGAFAWEYTFTSTGKCELNESQLSHSR